MIKNFFTLRKKIYLLSTLSALFLVAMLFISYTNLTNVLSQFDHFSRVSEFAKKNLSLSKNVEVLKASVMKYTYTGKEDSARDVHENYKEIMAQLHERDVPKNDVYQENFVLIKEHLQKYYMTFLELEKQLSSHHKILQEKRNLSDEVEANIQNYFNNTNSRLQETLYWFHENFHAVEKNNKLYFETLDTKYLKLSKKGLKEILYKVNFLLQVQNETANTKHLRALKENIKKFTTILNKEIQHTRSYQFLVNVVMAAEAYEVNHYAILISDESQRILSELDDTLHAIILKIINTLATTGILFVGLLLLLSYLIARSIVKPLSSITKAFSALASGQTDTEIPQYHLKDEIGLLTKSATSFLEKNKEIHELLHSTEELTHQLSLNQERFLLALEGAQNGLWDWNLQTEEVYYSLTWKNMFGYSDKEIDNSLLAWKEIMHPKDLVNTMDAISYYLSHKSDTVFESEMRILCKNGTYKHVLARGKTIMNTEGVTTRFIGLCIDVTEQKRIEQDLKAAKLAADEASKAKSDFLANMSHEIRTPLNGIIGLTDLVLKTDLSEKQEDYLHKSKTSSIALLRIINDILDYSKIEAGKLDLEENPFNLDELMQNIQNLFEYQANQKGLVLKINSNVHMNLLGDALRITQIFTNLVGNAIKFTQKGSVTISSQIIHEDEHSCNIEFSVEDTGIGVQKDIQDKLFSEFSQADNSITRKFGGTGLGLAICKQLVKMMDGNISMQSTLGEGSTITFNARLAKLDEGYEQSDTQEFTISKEEIENLKNMNLLLVEDNKTNQIVAMGLLEDYISDFDIANNGQEAVEMVQESHYDLILMDLQMPVMDGFEATKIIRELDEYKEVPIIALSAAVMKEDLKLTKDAGMNEHLSKPIDKDALLKTLVTYS